MQATKNQINDAEKVMNEIVTLMPSGDATTNVALSILTAGILIATQLNQIACSIDCDKIANAIEFHSGT